MISISTFRRLSPGIILGLFFTVLVSFPAQAHGPPCMSPAEAQSMLDQFSEKRAFNGITGTRALVQVYIASPSQTRKRGSWTVLLRTPNGAVCILAAGHEWDLKEPGDGT